VGFAVVYLDWDGDDAADTVNQPAQGLGPCHLGERSPFRNTIRAAHRFPVESSGTSGSACSILCVWPSALVAGPIVIRDFVEMIEASPTRSRDRTDRG
jgi:hypothetical protein